MDRDERSPHFQIRQGNTKIRLLNAKHDRMVDFGARCGFGSLLSVAYGKQTKNHYRNSYNDSERYNCLELTHSGPGFFSGLRAAVRQKVGIRRNN